MDFFLIFPSFCSVVLISVVVLLIFALGRLLPGGTVVEGTAGNTGIGLAHMCNALGYKCVIFMPNTQSQVRGCVGYGMWVEFR